MTARHELFERRTGSRQRRLMLRVPQSFRGSPHRTPHDAGSFAGTLAEWQQWSVVIEPEC
jgi:hypothetical protein